MTNPADILEQLDEAAQGLDAAADELRRLLPLYEGYRRQSDDEFVPGARLRWEELVDGKLAEIAAGYEQREKRPPAKEVLEARARAQAKSENPELHDEFHALAARIFTLQKWISSKKDSISARQSILRAEGILAGR